MCFRLVDDFELSLWVSSLCGSFIKECFKMVMIFCEVQTKKPAIGKSSFVIHISATKLLQEYHRACLRQLWQSCLTQVKSTCWVSSILFLCVVVLPFRLIFLILSFSVKYGILSLIMKRYSRVGKS